MDHTLLVILVAVVAIALIFDFLNGFHDAANAIATIVITRTLTPGQAVIMAGMAEFLGYFMGGAAVAKMISSGIVNINVLRPTVETPPDAQLIMILSALIGAVTWNILTWLWGLPSSSSHALIGGLVGSMLAAFGYNGLALKEVGFFAAASPMHFTLMLPTKILLIMAFIFIAPLLSMLCSSIFTLFIIWCFRRTRPATAGAIFKKLQLVSAAWYCTGHGRNDAQKTMGIIALAMLAVGLTTGEVTPENPVPLHNWVVFSCYFAIALGTMFGGWRIVKTMGTKITKIRPMEGFCAESAAGLILMGTAHFGMPCSTTHVISGSIMGVGAVEHAAKVRWNTARTILWAWILTIPLTAIYTYIIYLVINYIYLAIKSPIVH
jgi:PiT family inorganic phosphate transporter